MSSEDRSAVVADAARALADGRAVVVPTDTVYAAAVSPGKPEGFDLLARLSSQLGQAEPGLPVFAAWNPASPPDADATAVEQTIHRLRISAPAHRMLLRRLAPGPAIFLVPVEKGDLPGLERELGLAPGVARTVWGPDAEGNGPSIAIRFCPHPTAATLIDRTRGPVLLTELPSGRGRWASDAASAAAIIENILPRASTPNAADPVMIDDGGLRAARPATVIRLTPEGGYTIERPGAYEERFVDKQLHRTVLFVCSGNTCRSPMAEAIAADLLARDQRGSASIIRTRVESAGTGAPGGAPATGEAVAALRELGVDPSVLHGSRPLTRRLLDEADAVFVMTRSHLQAARALDPAAAGKIELLDPNGHDIPDPIGATQEVYAQTARRLRDAIAARLKELDQ